MGASLGGPKAPAGRPIAGSVSCESFDPVLRRSSSD